MNIDTTETERDPEDHRNTEGATTGHRRELPGAIQPRTMKLLAWAGVFSALLLLVALGLAYEFRTSHLQARFLSRLAERCTFHLEQGPSPAIRYPVHGPHDERLGYVGLPGFISRLNEAGYQVTAQARQSETLLDLGKKGITPPFREKGQAGLRITDHRRQPLASHLYPERVYPDFRDVPKVVVESLLFIENRELLDPRFPRRNPAVEWDRLARAVVDLVYRQVDPDRNVPGGSTLATQMEKYRHSPRGLTSSVEEKFRQMASASLRAYRDGENTLESRKLIVLDFINSMPLGAVPGAGEVNGLGDGLFFWYGADFAAASTLLATRPRDAEAPQLAAWGLACKQVLSLFVAQRRPSHYLLEDPRFLEAKTDSYLRLLTNAGLLTPWERDAALAQKLQRRQQAADRQRPSFVERKGVNAVKTGLLSLLDISQTYQLQHLDLTVQSSIDNDAQQRISSRIRQMATEEGAEAAGLVGHRLLEQGQAGRIIHSLTLYERGQGANLLRIQTDNFDQPLSINEGVKLELGSSAKLRTTVTYLEIIAALHGRYAALSPEELRGVPLEAGDRLSRWAVDYLGRAEDRELRAMLAAAMDRHYSASPEERFFTGGGLHSFVNFDAKDDGQSFSVRQALHQSINLVFIRLMRDIVHYYMYRIPGISALLADPDDARRREYLSRFADQEGSLFLRRFHRKYKDKSLEEAFAALLQGMRATPERLALVYRYVQPEAGEEEFASFLQGHFPEAGSQARTVERLYRNNGPEAWTLVDRGYLARVHPLELWTLAYLARHPGAASEDILAASAEERQAVYSWLFKTSRKNKQDNRIRSLLEQEAFHEIHADWKRLRYPFDALVPSYATAIGSSADRPAALAELMGILLNNGKWYPSVRVQELHFAADTPYETVLRHQGRPGEQLLAPEVAEVMREALAGVVTEGTAKRVAAAFPDADGTPLVVGGKTGTGDNRHEVYGPGGRLLHSTVLNRTAVFVFFLGERFYGTITAYVAGTEAANYRFTSGLPVQVLKELAPEIMRLVGQETDPGKENRNDS